MTLQAQVKTAEYYDYQDIQKRLCELMGIEEQYFRGYEKLVGGNYKDFWHQWLEFIDENVRNDSMTTVYWGWDYDETWRDCEYFVNKLKEKRTYGTRKGDPIEYVYDWVGPLFDAMDELMKELGKEKINIWYCW